MEAIRAARILFRCYRRHGVLTDDVLVALVRRRGRLRAIPKRFWLKIRQQLTREGFLQRYAHRTFVTGRGNSAGWMLTEDLRPHGCHDRARPARPR